MEEGVTKQPEVLRSEREDGLEMQSAKEQDILGMFMQDVFGLREVDARVLSPLALAYIGDAVYDLVIRTLVVNKGNQQVQKLHKETVTMVQASAQARMITALNDRLSEEEHAVYKRGRNAKSMSPAKNQSISDYHKATGFEALMGYLYLKKEWKRMLQLIKLGLDALENEES